MTADVVTTPSVEAAERDAPASASTDKSRLISLTGVVRGGRVEARNAVIGGVSANEVHLERGLARTVLAGERAEIHQAAAQLVLAGRDVTVERGGAQAVVANGSVRITQGGAGVAVARRVEVGEGGLVVIALAPSLAVDGGRVLVGPLAGLAMIGALVAAVMGIAGIRRRRRHH